MQISFDARIKISTEMHCAHQYLSIDLKNVLINTYRY